MLYKKMIPLFIMSLILSGCLNNSKKKTKTLRGRAHVGELPSSGQSTNFFMSALTTQPKWGSVESTNNYAIAKVDGIKVKIKSIWGSNGGNQTDFTTLDQELELSQGTNTIAISKDIVVPVGNYTESGISLENKVGIKAFCRTANKCLYTTVSGVKVDPLCGDTADLPSDYDYYQYDFLHVTNLRPTSWEGYRLNFNVTEESTPNLFLLIDSYKMVSCWDGIRNVTPPHQQIPPFSWALPDPNSTLPFPDNSISATEDPRRYGNVGKSGGQPGAFGVGYIPFFTYLGEDADDIPYAQSYLATGTGITPTIHNALLTTFAVDRNENIVAARSRKMHESDHGTQLEQGWTIEKDTHGSLVLYSGEHYPSKQRWSKDRMITGFELFDHAGTEMFIVKNGPECAEARMTCLTDEVETNWVRLDREE